MEYNSLSVVLKTLLARFRGASDLSRWRNVGSFDAEWADRRALMSRMIRDEEVVVEFGSGDESLGRVLPAGRYIPFDLFKRSERTRIIDLNTRPLPDLAPLNGDVAFMAGVLEYVADLPSLCVWLEQQFRACIVSYNVLPESDAKLKSVVRRAGAGWLNDFTEKALVATFVEAGFSVEETQLWVTPSGTEQLFRFSKAQRSKPA